MRILRAILSAIEESRQASANYQVARLLHRTEYPNESFERIYASVRDRKLEDLK